MIARHILFTTALLLLSACSTIPEAVYQDPRIEALGKMDNLAITSLRTADKNGFLAIQAEVTNYSTSEQRMHYRFRWMDQSGMVTGSEEAWKIAVLQPLDKKYINSVAPSRQAMDFRMVVQSPENTVWQSGSTPGSPSGGNRLMPAGN